MSDVLNRVAIADVTGTLTTDFDLPTLLQTVATHARGGFDAYSAVIVLRDDRRSTAGDDLHIVAESCQAGVGADTQLNTTGPALNSAHDGAVTLVTDLATIEDTRWPGYRQRALSTGLRGVRAYPVKALSVPVGSLVIHTQQPWDGSGQPSEFGQILANLVAIALSTGASAVRQSGVSKSVDTVLEGNQRGLDRHRHHRRIPRHRDRRGQAPPDPARARSWGHRHGACPLSGRSTEQLADRPRCDRRVHPAHRSCHPSPDRHMTPATPCSSLSM